MQKVDEIQNEDKTLQEKVAKHKTNLKVKSSLQVGNHSLWDTLVVDITKFRQYSNFVEDKNVVSIIALQKCTVVNETLPRRSCETTQNAINFLNLVSNVWFHTLGFKEKTYIIVWARKIIEKHKHMRNVQEKEEHM